MPISWFEVLELLRMMDAQVLQCLLVCLMWWEGFAANTLYVSTIFPSEMLDRAGILVCLSVGLKCRKFGWESCANTLYVSTIIPSDNLAKQVLGVRVVLLHRIINEIHRIINEIHGSKPKPTSVASEKVVPI